MDRHLDRIADTQVFVKTEGGASEATKRTLERALGDSPAIRIQDKQDLVDDITGTIGIVLNLLYGMLALAVIVAVLGVVNTLAMSVHERSQEIGMLMRSAWAAPLSNGWSSWSRLSYHFSAGCSASGSECSSAGPSVNWPPFWASPPGRSCCHGVAWRSPSQRRHWSAYRRAQSVTIEVMAADETVLDVGRFGSFVMNRAI